MDFIIIVTSNAQQETFWQRRLTSSTGLSHRRDAKVVVVQEDWPGGAGNGLGTLYAYQKAISKARTLYDVDLLHEQEKGASVAMYHTAGKGTRLAPLPGSEQNNKSAVKLPCIQQGEFVTILEAVMRQTSLYAEGRRGRLSVFWGDQVFIPAASPAPSQHHADILGCLAPLPTREQWEARGLHRYGLIAVLPNGCAKLLEKVTYDIVLELQASGVVTADTLFGTSLGSFSVSYALLCSLLSEFNTELCNKQGKMDSDPHFWMPFTLDEATYVRIMLTKGMDEEAATFHFKRMQALKVRVQHAHEDRIFFSAIDVGEASYWWDFGTLKSYYDNCLKLTRDDLEGHAMRTFFGESHPTTTGLDIDRNSYLQDCHIKSGRIRNSVLVGVTAHHVDVSHSIMIDSRVATLHSHQCLLYNVKSKDDLKLSDGCVRADASLPAPFHHFAMQSRLGRDSNKDWNQRLDGNPLSYAELFLQNETSSNFTTES